MIIMFTGKIIWKSHTFWLSLWTSRPQFGGQYTSITNAEIVLLENKHTLSECVYLYEIAFTFSFLKILFHVCEYVW